MFAFNYHRARSIPEAVSLLGSAEDGKLLAGGHTLIPTLKQRLAAPSDLIDLSLIGELHGIHLEDGVLTIGAMTPHADVAASPFVQHAVPELAALAGSIGDPAVRNRGTIGGSLANNDPSADYPAACLALGATIVTDQRRIAADDFFLGLFETALQPTEIIVSVEFPALQHAAYEKFPNPASRYAMAGVFVARRSGDIRVAVTGAGQNGVFRWNEAETALSETFASSALKDLTLHADEMIEDIHGSGAYRAHLVGVMAKRAVARLEAASVLPKR